MRSGFHPAVLAVAVALVWGVADASARPYEETKKVHSWFSFSRPVEKTPAAQLKRGDAFREDGRLRKATRAYKALVVTWPGSPEAALAQYRRAKTLDERGKLDQAFDEYQALMDRFTGLFPHDEVLARQFEIAKATMKRKRGSVFGLGGFEAPERAVPMFEAVIRNGPRSAFAPEAAFLAGMAQERAGEYELAVVAYMTSLHRYPDGAYAERSALGRARVLKKLSEESPNDVAALEQAWAATVLFLNTYPRSAEAPLVEAYRDTLAQRRARAAYDKAVFYDRLAKKPDAAREAYSSFVSAFPNSEWAGVARQRLAALGPAPEKTK